MIRGLSAARQLVLLVLLAGFVSSVAGARDTLWRPAEENASWRAECGSCHFAYPPGLLAAADWLQIMSQLDRHFGADASLGASARQQISDYLQRNGASTPGSNKQPELPRITRSERFVDKHRSAIRLWQKGQVKTLSDCAACHKDSNKPGLKD
jgi:hypothetical protein